MKNRELLMQVENQLKLRNYSHRTIKSYTGALQRSLKGLPSMYLRKLARMWESRSMFQFIV